ncbi:MAG TPA: hypothetical protein VMT20_14465 [Terriglobia bacterium]|nr:hypothetical protein [Terriglobia bacterium]
MRPDCFAGTGVISWAEPSEAQSIPAQAGIQFFDAFFLQRLPKWIPAYARMTAFRTFK